MKLRTIKSKLPKSIKRITILKSDSAAGAESIGDRVVVKRKRKRKKQSKGIVRILERATRRAAKANEITNDNYLDRHRRSNRKRRDGWLRDLGYNWSRANRKGSKKFKFSKLFD
jgi:hypothetical protein